MAPFPTSSIHLLDEESQSPMHEVNRTDLPTIHKCQASLGTECLAACHIVGSRRVFPFFQSSIKGKGSTWAHRHHGPTQTFPRKWPRPTGTRLVHLRRSTTCDVIVPERCAVGDEPHQPRDCGSSPYGGDRDPSSTWSVLVTGRQLKGWLFALISCSRTLRR